MNDTSDAENKPAISGLIATKPHVLALVRAPVLLALAPATIQLPAPAAETIIFLPGPAIIAPPIFLPNSLRSQDCCKVYRIKVDHNIFSGTNVFGTSYMYCGELTCLHPPCIRYRVYKKFAIYSDAFGMGFDIFFDILYINDINTAVTEVAKLFKQYLILDCFDHIEFFASIPIKKKVNTSIFQKVKDYQMELLTVLEHHMVQQPHLSVTVVFDSKRVRHKNIIVNKPSKRVATIDGYYASPGPNLGKATGKKVIQLPIEKVVWRVHPLQPDGTFDMSKTIEVGYQDARSIYKRQIAALYDFEVV